MSTVCRYCSIQELLMDDPLFFFSSLQVSQCALGVSTGWSLGYLYTHPFPVVLSVTSLQHAVNIDIRYITCITLFIVCGQSPELAMFGCEYFMGFCV